MTVIICGVWIHPVELAIACLHYLRLTTLRNSTSQICDPSPFLKHLYTSSIRRKAFPSCRGLELMAPSESHTVHQWQR